MPITRSQRCRCSAEASLAVLDAADEAAPLGRTERKPRPQTIARVPDQDRRFQGRYFNASTVCTARAALTPDESQVPVGLSGHKTDPSFAVRFESPHIWRKGFEHKKPTKAYTTTTLWMSSAIECKRQGLAGLYVRVNEICLAIDGYAYMPPGAPVA